MSVLVALALGSIIFLSVVLIVGALTFFATWSLGPIVEHFAMASGKLF